MDIPETSSVEFSVIQIQCFVLGVAVVLVIAKDVDDRNMRMQSINVLDQASRGSRDITRKNENVPD